MGNSEEAAAASSPPCPHPLTLHTHTDSKMLSKRPGRLQEEHRAHHLSWMCFPKLAALHATLVGEVVGRGTQVVTQVQAGTSDLASLSFLFCEAGMP